jgi:hypothetical protein
MKPAHFFKRSRDKVHNWNKWAPYGQPGAKEIGGTTPGGKETSIDSESVAESAFNSRKYEKVTGGERSLATVQCNPE